MGFLSTIKRDFKAVFEKDPAARNAFEVIFAYPGFHAILLHRINHILYRLRIPVIPRLLSYLGRLLTGIEIHPAAKIGAGFFIDHGMGVVIGETAEIGEDCLLYQGVTLGGTGKEKGKRHPTLGRGVVVGAGAKILGAIRIGDYVKIGANSVILHSLPDYSIVVGVPGRVIKKKVVRVMDEGPVEVLDHVHLPDPVEDRFRSIEAYISELTRKIERLEGKTSKMKLYNTLTGKKEDLIPLIPGRVGMYVCGVTVYDKCHIGHGRSAIVFDVIRRYLAYKGFDVKFIKNFTDIDDKIINRARQEGISWDEVAKIYTEKYYEEMSRLGVEPATVEPKATEHIKEMIDIIKALLNKGYAYELNGDVYFEVSKFPDYGKLSKKQVSELLAGARVEIDERKRNPLDFALWKASKEDEPSWESPWGKGRPGWHIECSAMSIKHLGESFDIHGGGADLIFPHHENEIAQSEAFTGKPFVKYWLHNGFITLDKEKMSKSLGNFFTIDEILAKFDPEVVRFFLLGTHYRSPIEFSDKELNEAVASVQRYYTTMTRIEEFVASAKERSLDKGETESSPLTQEAQTLANMLSSFKMRFMEAMDDDFNTALAIGHIFELIREINKYLDNNPPKEEAKGLLLPTEQVLKEVGGVLNIFRKTPSQWYASFKLGLSEEEIQRLINERQEARERKDWLRADAIRKELEERGVILEDKKEGTLWKVKVV